MTRPGRALFLPFSFLLLFLLATARASHDEEDDFYGVVPEEVFGEDSGTISYTDYDDNEAELWLIFDEDSRPGARVRVQFTYFDVEDQSSCVYDYVKLFNGDTVDDPGVRLCGGEADEAADATTVFFHDASGSAFSLATNSFTSSYSAMLVGLRTDGSVTRGGFELTYEIVLPQVEALASPAAVSVGNGEPFEWLLPDGTFESPPAGGALAFTTSALPAWLEADAEAATGAFALRGTPDFADAGTVSVTVTATNEAGTSASVSLSIEVVATLRADNTSTLVCSYAVIDDATPQDVEAVAAGSLPPVLCTITARVGGAAATVLGADFVPQVSAGGGYASSLADSGYGTTFTFVYEPPPAGGEASVWDGVSAAAFDLVSYATPDATSTTVCAAATAEAGGTADCGLQTRRLGSLVYARYTGGAWQGAGAAAALLAAPAFEARPAGEAGGALVSAWEAQGAGSEWPFTATLPSTPGVYTVTALAAAGGGVDVTVVTAVDGTTSVECDDAYAVVGQPVRCAVVPRNGGVSAFASSSRFSVGVGGEPVEVGAFEQSSGDRIAFTVTATAPVPGGAPVSVSVDGVDADGPAATVAFGDAPDATSTVECGFGSVRVGGTLVCEVVARRNGTETQVFVDAFTPSVTPTASGASAAHLRENRTAADAAAPPPGTLGSRFEFTLAVGTLSRQLRVSDGVSGSPATVLALDDADGTSVMACDSATVAAGGSAHCTVAARRDNAEVFTAASALAVSVQSTGEAAGRVAPGPVSAASGGASGASSSFSFELAALTGSGHPTGPVTVRLEVDRAGNDTAPGTHAEVTVTLVAEPDSTSTLQCRNGGPWGRGAASRCSIQPRREGVAVHALASRFEPVAAVGGEGAAAGGDGARTAAVGALLPEVGDLLEFDVTPLRAHAVVALEDAGGSGTTVSADAGRSVATLPPHSLVSWCDLGYVQSAAGDADDTAVVAALASVALRQGDLRSSLGHGGGSPSWTAPAAVAPVEWSEAGAGRGLGSARVRSVACGPRSCLAATTGGDLVTWGPDGGDAEALGRDDTSGEAEWLQSMGLLDVVAVGAVTDVLGGASPELGAVALTGDGTLYEFGNVRGSSVEAPARLLDGYLEGVEFIAVSDGGGFFAAAARGGAVYTWGPLGSAGVLGRGGSGRTPLPLAFPGLGDPAPEIASVSVGPAYGVVLFGGVAGGIYSWGAALQHTVLGSGATPTQASANSTAQLGGAERAVARVECGSTVVVALAADGALFTLRLAEPAAGAGSVHAWERVADAQSGAGALLDTVFVAVSAGWPVVLAADSAGIVWSFSYPDTDDSLSRDPLALPAPVPLPGSAAGALVYSHLHQFVAADSPEVVVDPSAAAGVSACLASFRCASLAEALSAFTTDGTVFRLVEGTHDATGCASSASDIVIAAADEDAGAAAADATVIDCSGAGDRCLDLTGGGVQLRFVTVSGGNAGALRGGCLRVPDDAAWDLAGAVLRGCSAFDGGGVYAAPGAGLTLQDVRFVNCTAERGGGGVYADNGAVVSADRASFEGCSAGGDGGGLSLSAAAAGTLVSGSNFTGCEAGERGGAVLSDRTALVVVSSLFDGNAASSGGGIAAVDGSLAITDTVVRSCSATERGGGVFVEFSSVSLDGCAFEANSAAPDGDAAEGAAVDDADITSGLGGAFYCLGQRAFDASGGTISGNTAELGGGGYLTYSFARLDGVALNGNAAARSGGALLLSSSAGAELSSCSLAGNEAGARGGAVALLGADESALGGNSTAYDGNSAGIRGGAVYQAGGAACNWDGAAFTGNTAPGGGAVFWADTTDAPDFALATFAGNEATHGADRASLPARLEWTAEPDDGFEASSGRNLGEEVALSLLDHYGQVVSTESVASVTLRTTTAGAALSGAVVAAFEDGTATFNANAAAAAAAADTGNSTVSSVTFGITSAPGSLVEVLGSVTTDGRTLESPALAVAVRSCARGEYLASSLLCEECAAGTYSDTSDSAECIPCAAGREQPLAGQTACALCAPGSYAGNEGTAECTVCAKGTAAGDAGASACAQCEAGRFAADTSLTSCEMCSAGEFAGAGAFRCTACLDGTVAPDAGSAACTACHTNSLSSDGTRCLCSPTYYEVGADEFGGDSGDAPADHTAGSSGVTNGSVYCVACPTGADCTELGTVRAEAVPLEGYWAALNSNNAAFVKCLNSACLGREEREAAAAAGDDAGESGCLEGYTGHLCTVCEAGYGRAGDHDCERCPDPYVNRIRLAAAALVLVLVTSLFVYFTVKTALEPAALTGILMKIVLSCLQFNAIASSFEFEFPKVVDRMLSVQETSTSVGTSLLSVDCFLSENKERGSDESTSAFYVKSFVWMAVPVVLVLGSALVYGPLALWRRRSGRADWWHRTKLDFTTGVVIILFLVHPSVTEQAFRMLSCKRIGENDDDLFLSQDLSLRCWNTDHARWVGFVAVPMIVFWVVGIPAAGLMALHRNRHRMAGDDTQRRYGFLYKGYETSYYFWEVPVMLRKLFLVGIAVFFANSSQVQAIMAVLLITASLMGQVYARPFEDDLMDWAEFLSLLTSFVTFWGGLFLYVEDLNWTARVALSFIIVLANIGFLVFAVVAMYRVAKLEKMLKAARKEERHRRANSADSRASDDPRAVKGGADVEMAVRKMAPLPGGAHAAIVKEPLPQQEQHEQRHEQERACRGPTLHAGSGLYAVSPQGVYLDAPCHSQAASECGSQHSEAHAQQCERAAVPAEGGPPQQPGRIAVFRPAAVPIGAEPMSPVSPHSPNSPLAGRAAVGQSSDV